MHAVRGRGRVRASLTMWTAHHSDVAQLRPHDASRSAPFGRGGQQLLLGLRHPLEVRQRLGRVGTIAAPALQAGEERALGSSFGQTP